MEVKWRSEDRIAVAVSGGVDSMVLLDLVRTSERYSALYIFHVNHGLRAESIAEEEMLRDYAARYEIPLIVSHIPRDYFTPHKSIQEEARMYRYAFFEAQMAAHHIDVLLTAHHADDVKENILFRLLSGRYTQPLGIHDQQRILRPLLHMSKQDIYDIAKERAVTYMEDVSNIDTKYSRNALRKLMPELGSVPGASTQQLLEFADWHDDVLEVLRDNARSFIEHQGESIERAAFNALKTPVQLAVLQQLTGMQLAKRYLLEIIRVSQSSVSQASYPIACEWFIDIVYDKLYVRKKEETNQYLSAQSPGKYTFNDYVITVEAPLDQPLILSLRQPGDRIKIGAHHQKVSRIFIDSKISHAARSRMPILRYAGDIIAVGDIKQTQHQILKHIHIEKRSE